MEDIYTVHVESFVSCKTRLCCFGYYNASPKALRLTAWSSFCEIGTRGRAIGNKLKEGCEDSSLWPSPLWKGILPITERLRVSAAGADVAQLQGAFTGSFPRLWLPILAFNRGCVCEAFPCPPTVRVRYGIDLPALDCHLILHERSLPITFDRYTSKDVIKKSLGSG